VGSFYAFAIWIGLGCTPCSMRHAAHVEGMPMPEGLSGIGVLKYLVESISARRPHRVVQPLLHGPLRRGRPWGPDVPAGRHEAMSGPRPRAATLLGLAVPAVMVADGWDDHDRSIRFPARDLAGLPGELRPQCHPLHQRRQRHLPALVRPRGGRHPHRCARGEPQPAQHRLVHRSDASQGLQERACAHQPWTRRSTARARATWWP
jgi:hypothetical protein